VTGIIQGSSYILCVNKKENLGAGGYEKGNGNGNATNVNNRWVILAFHGVTLWV